jgi:hypothetical protein
MLKKKDDIILLLQHSYMLRLSSVTWFSETEGKKQEIVSNPWDFTPESSGFHTITVSANLKVQETREDNPAPAVANVFSREALGTVFPLMLQLTLTPPEVRPANLPDDNPPNSDPTMVRITLTAGGSPVPNHRISLSATGIPGSGGHNAEHHTPPNRPNPDVVQGHSFGVFSQPQGVTDENGVFVSVYTPTRFGGLETITAQSAQIPGIESWENLVVRVPGLRRLPRQDRVYHQVGGTDSHPGPTGPDSPEEPNNNHFGTQELITAIENLADAYNAWNPEEPPVGPLLAFNDMSLEWGGRFDINGNWVGGQYHQYHRMGNSVDLRVKTLSVYIYGSRRRRRLRDTVLQQFGNPPHEESRPGDPDDIQTSQWHWHLFVGDEIQDPNDPEPEEKVQ